MGLSSYPPAWYERRVLDALARKITAADDFAGLVEGTHPSYTPTLLVVGKSRVNADTMRLADAYDDAQRLRGDGRRAFRGQRPKK